MKALVYKEKNAPLALEDMVPVEPSAGQVQVALKAAALNHRDNWITKGLYPGIQENIILGSDGAGLVQDREVIINPNIQWGNNERYPSDDYLILGMPQHGTFAETITVDQGRLADKPAHLTMEQAAALPLAGLTAYRTLFSRCNMQAGENVLISGVGGGLSGGPLSAEMICVFCCSASP